MESNQVTVTNITPDRLKSLIIECVKEVLVENRLILSDARDNNKDEFDRKYISRKELMRFAGWRSNKTPWDMEQSGRLIPHKIGRNVFYERSKVDELMMNDNGMKKAS